MCSVMGDVNSGECPSEMSIASYLDGMMSYSELLMFNEHLAKCLRCRNAIIELQELVEYVYGDTREIVPAEDEMIVCAKNILR